MEIRTLKPEEFDEHMRLSQYAFQIQKSAEEIEEARSKAKFDEVYVAIEDGRILSQVRVIPLEIYWNGVKLHMGGVAAVASWPEVRRKGQVGMLLRHTLQEMRLKGQSVSMLAPFSIGFYRKFGWELYFDRVKYTLSKDKLPHRVHNTGSVERILLRENEELAALLHSLYEAYAGGFNGTLSRTPEWWEQSVLKRKQGDTALYRAADGRAQGYAIYKVKDRKLEIHELVYLTEEARAGLWNFFSNHDSMIDAAALLTYAGDPLPYQLPDPRIEQSIIPAFMLRIVDLEALIRQLPFNPGMREQFALQIKDEHAPWNEGTWLLVIDENGNGSVELCEEGALPQHLSLSIGTLAALLIGYKSAEVLQRMELISGPRSEALLLGSRIPGSMTNLLDFF